MWAIELTGFTNEDEGSSVIVVNVASPTVPVLQWREPVEVVDLEMIPWSQKGRDGDIRSGVAFRAKEIRPVGGTHSVVGAGRLGVPSRRSGGVFPARGRC